MGECVKVIVRSRPMNQREKALNCINVVDIDTKIAQCSIRNPSDEKAPPKNFTFDGAYGVDSTTEQIYNDIGYPLVEGVCEGYNGTIFAYGQTGCGKSFSMQGIPDPITQRGIIPRAFDHVFETIQASEGAKYLVHSSYLEIYNEEIRDLLGKDIKQKMELKEHPERGVYVQGLSMHPCKNVADCERIMAKGWTNRATGSTLMNAESSRSHSIFTISLERCDEDETGEEHIRAAKLNLVDLAGSERQAKTGATGDRLKEATKINLSLSALGNVISALVDGKSKHIPYRDSKLTRLLQDSLGGNTKTMMVACLSPADNNYDETLSTLRYANRAKNIQNKPKINEDPKDALLREYQEEITRLKAMLRGEIPVELGEGESGAVAQQHGSRKATTVERGEENIQQEKQRIKEEYEEQMRQMKQEFEEMKISKVKLEEEMSILKEHYEHQISAVENTHVQSPALKMMNGDGPIIGKKGGKKLHVKRHKVTTIDESEESFEQPPGDDGIEIDVGPHSTRGMSKKLKLGVLLTSELDPSWEGMVVSDPEQVSQLKDHQAVAVRNREGDVTVMSVEDARTIEPDLEVLQAIDYDGPNPEEDYAKKVLDIASQLTQVKTINEDGEVDIIALPSTPSASPTGEGKLTNGDMPHKEALKKLQELQQQMVGGELASNEEIKEKRRRKKKHADERKRKLQEALEQMEGEDIMLAIYDNIEDELKAKDKLLEIERKHIEQLKVEVKDIQAEFEFDRIDYLDSMRKQEQHIKWLEAVIDKIHPCLRRDCNYINLERVKAQSVWNTEEGRWTLPKMTIENSRLPQLTDSQHDAPPTQQPRRIENELRSEERLLHKLHQKTESPSSYFKSNRQERLLMESQMHERKGMNSSRVDSIPSKLDDLRSTDNAAPMNGQDTSFRKPQRLEALPLPSAKKRKNKVQGRMF